MTARRLSQIPLALFGALALACTQEPSTAPASTDVAPSFSRQSAPGAGRFYAQHNLVSDGAVPADHVDPALVNAWGLVASGTSPWWVSDNGTDSSTLYNNGNTGATVPLRRLLIHPCFTWHGGSSSSEAVDTRTKKCWRRSRNCWRNMGR